MLAVVDTNVPVVANGRSIQASPECVKACKDALQQLTSAGKIVIDDNFLIIKEYHNNLNDKGQPGYGDFFLKWLLTNHKNPNKCECVSITPLNHNNCNFAEFPSDPHLISFDPADKKFVAVANKHPRKPPILEAVDVKWLNFIDILAENGINVKFIC